LYHPIRNPGKGYSPDWFVIGCIVAERTEAAVKLGYKNELAAVEDEVQRQDLFDKLVAKMYEIGKASEAAAHLEIDGVIDPADIREVILKTINSAPISK